MANQDVKQARKSLSNYYDIGNKILHTRSKVDLLKNSAIENKVTIGFWATFKWWFYSTIFSLYSILYINIQCCRKKSNRLLLRFAAMTIFARASCSILKVTGFITINVFSIRYASELFLFICQYLHT